MPIHGVWHRFNEKVNRLKHLGDTSLRNVFSNLPDSCQKRLRKIEDSGWACSFYLGVVDDAMAYGMTARKGEMQCIACSSVVETAVDNLCREVFEAERGMETG